MKTTTGILLALLALVTSCTKEPETLSGVYVRETDVLKGLYDFRSDGTVYSDVHPIVPYEGMHINKNGKGTYEKRGPAIRIVITNELAGGGPMVEHVVSVETNFLRIEGQDLILISTNSEGKVSTDRYTRQ